MSDGCLVPPEAQAAVLDLLERPGRLTRMMVFKRLDPHDHGAALAHLNRGRPCATALYVGGETEPRWRRGD